MLNTFRRNRQCCTSLKRLAQATGGIACLLSLQNPAAAQVNATWTGPSGGAWTTSGNWSGGVAPNNGANRFNVFIDAGNVANNNVILTGSTTINNITISAGDAWTIANNSTANVVGNDVTGLITNSGTIALASGGGLTQLNLNLGSIGLTGSGVLTMVSNSRISGSGTLHNVDSTISGTGSLGFNALNMLNSGTIAAVGAGSLNVDPNAGFGMTNTGTLLADTGSALRFIAGTISGAGGKVIARNGALVSFGSGVALDGQSFQTVGTGSIETVAGASVTITNFTNSGAYFGQSASSTSYSGINSNSGSFTLANADLAITGSGTVTLTGAGTINLTAANSRMLGVGTLIIDNYIRGIGSVGFNNMSLRSSNVVIADIAAGTLTLDAPPGGLFVNTGTYAATGGGTLSIIAGSYDNSGGRLHAEAASGIVLGSGVDITGGTLMTSGSGVIQTATGASVTLRNLNNLGNYVTFTASNTFIEGTINNLGSFTIASNSDFEMNNTGTVVLSGAGTINLSAADSRVLGLGTLVTNNYIRGLGSIGFNSSSIRNSGVITADVAGGTLTIDPVDTGALVNNGVLRAENGGRLSIIPGTIENSGGSIVALPSSGVFLGSGALIVGGSLSTSGSGTIGTAIASSTTLRNVTNVGNFVAGGSSNTFIDLSTINTGSFNIGANSDFELAAGSATVTLSGGGTVNLTASDSRVLGVGTLVTDNYIRGSGSIGFNQMSLQNSGIVVADVAGGTLNLDSPPTGFFNNTGILRASNGGILAFIAGPYNSAGGTYEALAGSTIALGNGATVVGGNATVNGTLVNASATSTLGNVAGSGTVLSTGGTLAANHYRVGSLSVSSGTISVLLNGTNSGTSKVDNVSVTGTGRFDLTDNDLIVTTTAKATVQALIVAARNAGSWNGVGITSSAAKNDPAHITTLGLLSGSEYNTIYGGAPFDGFTVANSDTVVKYTYYGDADFNGKVDGADYARVDTTFNNEATLGNIGGWVNGDFDYNGKVDGADYALIDAAFNSQTVTLRPGEMIAVPEPATTLAVLVLSAMGRRRRRF